MKSIGLIGLDTSHVSIFAKILHDPSHPHHIPGARITVAYPGVASPDFALSIDRVEGYTTELRDEHGVHILDSAEAVAETAELVFIESVDGRVHLDLFRRVAPFGKPVFIDKPFTVDLAEAKEIVRIAQEASVPLMSCSSLRYAEALQNALADGRDDIAGCDVFGPMAIEPTQPGLFWYGCHSVEMLVAAMGPGCREVRCVATDSHDLLTLRWQNGRIASLHGLRGTHGKFGAVLHRKSGPVVIDAYAGRPYYHGLLTAILGSLPHGRSAVPAEEMLEVVAIMEAGNRSRANDGAPQIL